MKKLSIHNFLQSNIIKNAPGDQKKDDQSVVNSHFLNLYEQILDNSRDILYCVNASDFSIEYISPSIVNILGTTREEILSSSIDKLLEFLHPDDKNVFLNHFRRIRKNYAKNQTIEYRLRPPKGIYRWINDSHSLIFDTYSKSDKIIGSLHDITDQKLTENALTRSRDRLYMAIEATNDGMWDWKIDTNELYFDQRFYTMLGYEPNEFPSKFQEWMKRIHPEDIKSVQSQLEKHLQGKSPSWTIEYRFKTKDNNWIWILNRGKVFDRDEDDKPLRMVGTHSDISVRKKTELVLKAKNCELLDTDKKLKDTNIELQKLYNELLNKNDELKKIYEQLQISEERFRQLAENTQDIFWLRDNSSILYINPAFDKIWGRDRNEVLSNPSILNKWIHPSDRSTFKSWIDITRLKPNEFYEEQYRIIKPDGDVRWIWARMFPVTNAKGIVYRLTGIATDITDLKTIESELIEAKEKAMESDRLKSAFLANISHEIRTPMNGIIGFASLLKEKVLSREKQTQFIDIITQSSVALLHIIEDLVDISKIEANQLQISKNEVDLNKFIDQIYDHYSIEKQLYGKQNIEFVKEKRALIPNPVIYSDEVRLNQILNNLISNAFKFTEKGSIKFGYSMVSFQDVEFFVSDTGIGIADEVKPHIFKRFRQQETSLTRKFGGTGLGLSICEGLVKLLNGNIWFESSKDTGTTFYISLPVSQTDNQTTTAIVDNETGESYYWPNKIILLVEDNPVNQEYFRTILKPTGANVMISITGEDAISLVESMENINLILMDIRLPNMSGYEAFKKIKQIRPNLDIIAQTAYAMSEDANHCLELGFSDFISKPVSRNILLSKINVFLSKK